MGTYFGSVLFAIIFEESRVNQITISWVRAEDNFDTYIFHIYGLQILPVTQSLGSVFIGKTHFNLIRDATVACWDSRDFQK